MRCYCLEGLHLVFSNGTSGSSFETKIFSDQCRNVHFGDWLLFNSLWPGDAIWHQGIVLSSGSSWVRSLQWRHNERDGIPNHQPYDCLLNRLFRHRLKKTSKLRVTSLCAGNSPVTSEFPTQMASNAEIVSIWWHHHVITWHQFSPKPLPEPLLMVNWILRKNLSKSYQRH